MAAPAVWLAFAHPNPFALSLLGPCTHYCSSGVPSLSALPSSAFCVLSTGQGLNLAPGLVPESSWTPTSKLFWAQGRNRKWKLHVPYV